MNLSTEIAQLRHAYKLLNDGAVLNTKELARGLIGPLIESLEEKTQRDADTVCKTCGGSKIDPGGLPVCRDCRTEQPIRGASNESQDQ